MSGAPSFHQQTLPGLGRRGPPTSLSMALSGGNISREPLHGPLSLSSHSPSPHLHMAPQTRERLWMPQPFPTPPAHSSSGQGFLPGIEPKDWPVGPLRPPWQAGHPQPPPSSMHHFHPAPIQPEGTREGAAERASSPVTSPTQPHSNGDLNVFPELGAVTVKSASFWTLCPYRNCY